MKRVHCTEHRLPRVVNSGAQEPKVNPDVVAMLLGASNVLRGSLEAALREPPLRSRLAELERRERLLAAWLEHAKKRGHDAVTIACLEDWLAGDEEAP